jgi:hypothetical protein
MESMTMYTACAKGRVDDVRRLLDAGEDVNNTAGFSMTPVMRALVHGHIDVVRLLHERWADLSRVDASGRNVLHVAANGGNIECIVWVFANTAIDVNSEDNHGHTPISLALLNSNLMAHNLLIERGANLFIKNIFGRRAIDYGNGPQLLQHAKNLLWESVKPLLLLSKAISIAVDYKSLPSPVLPSVDKAFGISGIVRRIASYLKRGKLIVRDPSIPKEDQEPDDVKRRVEATLAKECSKKKDRKKKDRK